MRDVARDFLLLTACLYLYRTSLKEVMLYCPSMILSPLLGDHPNEKVNSVGSLLRHRLHGRPIDYVTLSFEHITVNITLVMFSQTLP